MTSRGWALMLLLLLPQEPREPAAVPPELPPCVTCEGEGSALMECAPCAGTGEALCTACTSPVNRLQEQLDLAILRIREPEKADVLVKALTAAETATEGLLGNVRATPGTLRCPGGCKDGRVLFADNLKCKPCKGKGDIACRDCRGKGVGPCWSCVGARSLVQPCPECVGTGKSPGLAARTSATLEICPWCSDERLRTCASCPKEGTELRACETCARVGDQPCRPCASTTKRACAPCRASGDTSAALALFDQKSGRCKPCFGKGVKPCDTCTRGRTPCVQCKGEGEAQSPCRACRGRKHLPCTGCLDGGSHAWLVTADRLLASGSRELALAHIEQAIARETARIAAEVDALEVPSNERTKLSKKLERERLEPLRKRLAEAREE